MIMVKVMGMCMSAPPPRHTPVSSFTRPHTPASVQRASDPASNTNDDGDGVGNGVGDDGDSVSDADDEGGDDDAVDEA